MEINRKEEYIIISNNGKEIEKYKFEEEINFSKLVQYLLGLNLSVTLEVEDKVIEKKQEEESLINIVKSIINDYNAKVLEYETFKKSLEESNNNY